MPKVLHALMPILRTAGQSGRRARWLSAAAVVAVSLPNIAAAPSPSPDARLGQVIQAGIISVEIDRAYSIDLSEPATTVFVANPDIADVQAQDPSRVLVFGRKSGTTSVYVTTRDGRVSAYTVNVTRAVGQVEAALRGQAPDAGISVTSAPNGLTVTGRVATPRQAEALKSLAEQFLSGQETLNFNVGVAGQTQVNLQVRIVEVSREVSRTFGFNWDALSNNGSIAFGLATGRPIVSGGFGTFTRDSSLDPANSIGFGYRSPSGNGNIQAVIDALKTEGLISILAEPNLTASSGETASFLAGGEFPVPVSQQNNAITIEWKKFGVALDFTPTVLDPGRLSIKVRPEVSEISDKGSVTINNIKVPGIIVRRAETTVELGSGQSFAIAGLFQNNMSSTVRQFPWLGDVPVLGPLFRSNSFTNDQTELVIIVTPYVVEPVSRTSDLHTPADGLVFTHSLEEVVLGKRSTDPGAAPVSDRPHLSGPAGFVLEDKR